MGAVFLSYASQDAEAASRICDALRKEGIEVWFDQSELRGGDAWDARIRRNIKDCALFVPVISRHTQERAEGYFRLEWHLAEQRTFLMASDEPFLVPVVVDDTSEQAARVPERFRDRQWTRLPGGAATSEFAGRIEKLLGKEQEAAPALPRPAARAVKAPPRRRSFAIGLISVAAAAAIAGVLIWQRTATRGQGLTISNAPTRSPVDDLLARAAAASSGPPGFVPSKEALDSTGKLLEQAKSIDPVNGEIWAYQALNDLLYVSDAIDPSAERINRITSEVDRSLTLAPRSFNARKAHAYEMFEVAPSGGALQEAEIELRKLLQESPGDRDIMLTLGHVLRIENRPGEAAAILIQADFPTQAAWEYLHIGDWKKMDTAADLALKKDPLDVEPKIQVELYGFEDAESANRLLESIPPQEMLKDYSVSFALNFRYMLRQPQKILEICSSFPREWVASWYFLEPKALWEGDAYHLMGQMEAAKAKWRIALKEIDDRLATAADDCHLLILQSDMYSALGRNDEATTSLQLYEQLRPNARSVYGNDRLRWMRIKIRLSQSNEALDWLNQQLHHPDGDFYSLHGEARFFPDLDPLRADPSYKKLMRETKPAVAKPFD